MEKQLTINTKVDYLLTDHRLVRHEKRVLGDIHYDLIFDNVLTLVSAIDHFLENDQDKVILNGWEIKRNYYSEEESWMTPGREYEVSYYQIRDSRGKHIFPKSIEELQTLRDFLST